MTQPSPTATAQPQPPTTSQSQSTSSIPAFTTLQNAIQAAATGDRTSIYHLFLAIFTSARAAVRCLSGHYKTHHHLLTFETLARLKYCASRLEAIFYTLRHAPERFLTPAQLRAITRARAVLAHIWNQPVTFDPLVPYLTSPANCPPPPRSVVAPASCRHSPSHTPDSTLPDPASPRSASSSPSSSSPANPLLLNSPGRALASVLLQLAALYGLTQASVPVTRASAPATSAPATSATVPFSPPSVHNPPRSENSSPADSFSPHSTLHPPRLENPQSPLRPPP